MTYHAYQDATVEVVYQLSHPRDNLIWAEQEERLRRQLENADLDRAHREQRRLEYERESEARAERQCRHLEEVERDGEESRRQDTRAGTRRPGKEPAALWHLTVQCYTSVPQSVDFEHYQTGNSLLSNPVVLIAEDDADMRELLRNLLEPHGYDVVCAEDAILAYGILSTVHPSLIVIDIMMPEVDGIGLIRWIRAHHKHADTPIIAISAYGEDRLREAMEVGATATASKPADIPRLPGMIDRLLGRSRSDII